MKTLLTSIIVIFALTLSVQAQEISKNALGLRLGDNNGFGAEISYQRYLSKNNRIEFDLGWRDSNNVEAFKLISLFQWVMNIDGGFNWYLGAGGGFGAFNTEELNGSYGLAAGNVGIEYNFDIPLLLSLDFRPELGFNNNFNNNVDYDIALGIRYQF